jgi:hypothetical protein
MSQLLAEIAFSTRMDVTNSTQKAKIEKVKSYINLVKKNFECSIW